MFYPARLASRERLPFYSAHFATVELNYPFYRVPPRERFATWAGQTPADFLFAVKANRVISHLKRLRRVEAERSEFLAAAAGLGAKLAAVLCQLPPDFVLDLPRLRAFLRSLPREPRWVFEFRHQSWLVDEVLALLEEHDAGFVVPVGGRLGIEAIAATGALGYLRMHGGRGRLGRFTRAELARWADEIDTLAESGRLVFVYFNNDQLGFAARNAAELRELLED